MTINGVYCHEFNCPVEKIEELKARGCDWCGTPIAKDTAECLYFSGRYQRIFCNRSCYDEYYE